MPIGKTEIIYFVTLVVAVITAAIPFLQSMQGVIPVQEAGEFALIITVLSLMVPFLINLIGILNSTNMMKRAELEALTIKK